MTTSQAHVMNVATNSSPRSPTLIENLLRGSEEAMPCMVLLPLQSPRKPAYGWFTCSRINSQAEGEGSETYALVLASKARRCDRPAQYCGHAAMEGCELPTVTGQIEGYQL
jgi:hypothetical protein